ncbi:hypothetical protein ABW20_dc0110117 [Dactylellina cionopaga]|nr:hypothetical protein ABW20_dc0110117 [Dactylellina cionopaga]
MPSPMESSTTAAAAAQSPEVENGITAVFDDQLSTAIEEILRQQKECSDKHSDVITLGRCLAPDEPKSMHDSSANLFQEYHKVLAIVSHHLFDPASGDSIPQDVSFRKLWEHAVLNPLKTLDSSLALKFETHLAPYIFATIHLAYERMVSFYQEDLVEIGEYWYLKAGMREAPELGYPEPLRALGTSDHLQTPGVQLPPDLVGGEYELLRRVSGHDLCSTWEGRSEAYPGFL